MTDSKRKNIRAPLNRIILFEDEGFIQSAQAQNISKGGILIRSLPRIPESKVINIALDLPVFPLFRALGRDYISLIDKFSFNRKIVYAKSELVRSYQGYSVIDRVDITQIAVKFVDVKRNGVEYIEEYVENFLDNIKYFLSLFEKDSYREGDNVILSIAGFLGYDTEMGIPLLRQKIIHDYHSLKSL